jgi:predicted dehydrogenase
MRDGASVAHVIEVTPVNTYRAEVEHFVDCIEQDREPWIGGAQALRVLSLALQAYESARTRRFVLAAPATTYAG